VEPEPRVVDNPDELRYELWLGDRLAGEIRYVREGGKVVLVHTEIDPGLEGYGLGNFLVQRALDDLRERGLEYVPLCPFVAAYLRRHPQS
jgi:predicted GNAT family acetyltransferase